MSRAPRREPCTICTAVAPDAVRTVRMYAATSADYEPRLVRKFSRLRTRTHRSTGCESDQDHDVSQVREDQRQPYFGLTALFDMAQCITWPAADRDRYLGPWDHSGQHPILVVN